MAVRKDKAADLPSVLCADHFYMTEKAIEMLKSNSKLVLATSASREKLIEQAKKSNAQVIIAEYFPITSEVIAASQALKGVVVWGVGYDHINVEAASKRGVYVANTRGSNAESVAEHVFSLLLSLSRKLPQNDAFVRRGNWTSREESGLPTKLRSHDLLNKTLGIIGLGAIGTRVERIAQGFNMRTLAYDPFVRADISKGAMWNWSHLKNF